MSFAKQLAMNFSVYGVKLPIELIDHIRGFAFEDRIVAFVKEKKKDIAKEINGAMISRKNHGHWLTESSENWTFQSWNEENVCVNISNINCSVCGEFWVTRNNNVKFVCRCPHPAFLHHDEDEDDHAWDDNEWDDNDKAEYWAFMHGP
jgi:hypothetical protein